MPRRNANTRFKLPPRKVAPVEPPEPTYDDLAKDLVRRHLASPAILGPIRQPLGHRPRSW